MKENERPERPIEQEPDEETRKRTKETARAVAQTINTPGWEEHIKPYLEEKIEYYENLHKYIKDTDTLEDIGLLVKVGHKVAEQLQAIFTTIGNWILDWEDLEKQKKGGGE